MPQKESLQSPESCHDANAYDNDSDILEGQVYQDLDRVMFNDGINVFCLGKILPHQTLYSFLNQHEYVIEAEMI